MHLTDPSLFREQAYIGGRWIGVSGDAGIAVRNPATGALLGHVPALGATETREAIEAARIAQVDWAARPAK